MAVETFSSISGALSSIIDFKSVFQMNRSAVLSSILPFAEGAGKNLQWDAVFGTNAPADVTIAEGADVTTFENDTYVPAVLQWGNYSTAFSMTGKALAAAKTSNQDLADLCKTLMEQGITRLTKGINRDLYAGIGTGSFIAGLDGAGAVAATGTYAGINRATYPQWAANVLANGGVGRSLTTRLMRDMKRTIYEACGEPIDLIITTPLLHEAYGMLTDPNRRYVENIQLRGQTITLDAGYRALEFDGTPMLMDTDCPAGMMYFLNTNYVKLRQLPAGPCCFVNGNAPGYVRLHGTPNEQPGVQTGMTQLTARINILASSGDYCRVQLLLYPQLQVLRPNANGVIKDLIL